MIGVWNGLPFNFNANIYSSSANKALVNALIAALQALANCNNSSGNSRALTDIANLLNATVSPATNPDQSLQQSPQQSQMPAAQWVMTFFISG